VGFFFKLANSILWQGRLSAQEVTYMRIEKKREDTMNLLMSFL